MAVASINIDYAKFSDFALSPPGRSLDLNPINSRVFVQYCLYNRDFPNENYKLDDNAYLSYEGGFLTEEDRLNIKYSDFEIKNFTNTAGGNLFVSGTSEFFSNINLLDISRSPINVIRNARMLESPEEFSGTTYDSDAMTVGDFKRYLYFPGMITFFRGDKDVITNTMPFWRICGLPDAGQRYTTASGQTIIVPDLLAKFIPGGQTLDRHTNTSSYKIGSTGGHDSITLTIEQIPIHNHNVITTIDGNQDPVLATTSSIGFLGCGGDTPVPITSYARYCTNSDATCKCTCSSTGSTRRCTDENNDDASDCFNWGYTTTCSGTRKPTYTKASDRSSVTGLNIADYTRKSVHYQNYPATQQHGEINIGGGEQHENRPLFYGLVPIIYVGVPR